MPLYAAHDILTGQIFRISTSPVAIGESEGTFELPPEFEGDDVTHYVFGEDLRPYPEKSDPWLAFDYVEHVWFDPRTEDEHAQAAAALVRDFRDRVNAKRLEVITAGIDVSLGGHGIVALQGRPEDQTSLQGLAFGAQLRLSLGDASTQMDFLDRNNVLHLLTPMQMVELWQKGAGFVSAIYARSWVIKEMDAAATDVNDPSLWNIA